MNWLERNTTRSANSIRSIAVVQDVVLIAAGVVLASVLPQSRNRIQEVPWMPLAVAVGLGLISESQRSE